MTVAILVEIEMTIRKMAFVKLTASYRKIMEPYRETPHRGDHDYYRDFLDETHFVYMGEIANMPGHGVFLGASGKSYIAFHPEDFEELSEDEI